MTRLVRLLPLAAALMVAHAAHGELKICNQSVALYNIAIGAEIDRKFHTEGWWSLPANSCVTPIDDDLEHLKLKYIYVLATTITGDSALDGSWDMCVDSKRFKIEKLSGEPWNCWVRGFQQARFSEIDTGSAKSWTVFIRPDTQ